MLSAAGAATAAVRARGQPRDGRGRAHRLLLLLLLSAQLVQVGQRAHRYRIPRCGCSVCLAYCGCESCVQRACTRMSYCPSAGRVYIVARLQRHARTTDRRHSVRPRDAATSHSLICALTCRYNDRVGARGGSCDGIVSGAATRTDDASGAPPTPLPGHAHASIDIDSATRPRKEVVVVVAVFAAAAVCGDGHRGSLTTLCSLLHPIHVIITRLLLLSWCILLFRQRSPFADA